MCGRFSLTNPEAVYTEFKIRDRLDLKPRFNIAPSQPIPMITEAVKGIFRLAMVRWGLLPFWAKERKISYKLINARAETLAEKPAFREAYRKRRCLIPADGFFEWKRDGKKSQPYYIHLKGEGLFTFAGLWESWQDPEGETIYSATIVTTEANAMIGKIHDRMPLIVKKEQRGVWLSPEADPAGDPSFIRPFDPSMIRMDPVGMMVNSPKNDAPGCIKRIG